MPALKERQHATDERDFLAHVFHLLSQPMTALQCSLELALLSEATVQEYRAGIEAALESAERLRERLLLVREMADAYDPGDLSCPVDLPSVLAEGLEELQPLFENAGGVPELVCGEVTVVGERSRLLRAFLYVYEHLASGMPAGGARPVISAKAGGDSVRVRFCGFGALPLGTTGEGKLSPQLEIARRAFEAAGGGLTISSHGGARECEVQMVLTPPRAERQTGPVQHRTLVANTIGKD